MQEIGNNIFLEETFTGVALGVITVDQGLLLLDSPLLFADQQSWREQTVSLSDGKDRYVLMLDTHIDRTTGMNALGGKIIGHDNTVDILANRPMTIKPQESSAGSEAEDLNLSIHTRWPLPSMTFSEHIRFYTGENPITIVHHPGAHLAACWVQCDAEKLVFVGDCVVEHQPPFLARSDLGAWLDELSMLRSQPWTDYRLVSSRSGFVSRKAIDKLADFLWHVKNSLPELMAAPDRDEAIRDLLPSLMRRISFDKKKTKLYRKRLAVGLSDYLKYHQGQDRKNG